MKRIIQTKMAFNTKRSLESNNISIHLEEYSLDIFLEYDTDMKV